MAERRSVQTHESPALEAISLGYLGEERSGLGILERQ